MFKKLRLKLTLTNVLVVSIIFFISVLGIYLVMEKITHDQTNQLINLISSDAGIHSSKLSEHNKHNEHQYRYFYVKLNTSGDIVSTSEGLDVTNTQLKDVISKTLSSSENRGKIELDNEPYRFTKNILEGNTGTSIIFVNMHSEHEMLDTLLLVLIIASILGLVLAFFGSLYMADRSLIPIKQAWKTQKDFIADASHELRTPLSVIETTLDLVIGRKDQSIESQIKWLENIQTENKRMTKLVSDMLFLARTDYEQALLEMKTFSLSTALLEAYIPFEAVALQQNMHLESFQGPQIDFYGDEARIKQLVIILIDNAIKYTPSGGSIGMILNDIGDSIEIIVSDTGLGIDKDHISKIFQRFYRVDKSRSRKEGSVGLGLSIADWIVKKHHGSIKVDSKKDEGTTFHIVLPKVKL